MTNIDKSDFEHQHYSLDIVNENSVLLQFHLPPDPRLTQLLVKIKYTIENSFARYLIDVVPAYTSLLIYIDNQKISINEFKLGLQQNLQEINFQNQDSQAPTQAKSVELPVYYHPEVGIDLERIAATRSLSIDDIIRIHTEKTYTIYTIGFAPGFPYMGDVDPAIAEKRLATPRARVAKGSVGIAGRQTGIYPQSLPGGWNIIGRTYIELFQVDRYGAIDSPLRTGDHVKFKAISREEFVQQGGSL